MSTTRNQSFFRLAIIAGIVLVSILIGHLLDELDLVLLILKAIGLVLLGITLLVTIHELGHFLTAKAFGMRVEAFSIGFPPKIFSTTRGDTEYQIGATPLGGYVKISGMIDESLDTDHINSEPKPYEFRAKPVWQRLIVMVGGVVMNILLGIFIFSMIKYSVGDQQLPISEIKYGVDVVDNTLGSYIGFKTGDKLVSFMGEELPYWEDYNRPDLLVNSDAYFEVQRNGQDIRLDVPEDILDQFSNDSIIQFLYYADLPPQVVVREGPAMQAGMQTGDLITKVDSTPVSLFSDLRGLLRGRANEAVNITYERAGQSNEVTVQLDSLSLLMVERDPTFFKRDTLKYGFFEAFGPGTTWAFGFLSTNVKGFSRVAEGKASVSKSLMGPIRIAKIFQEIFDERGWFGFWQLVASLSMILAFVNILPIPALDGGHVVFLLIEAVMRKEPSVKVRIIAQQIGMFIILGLMIFILFNDVKSFF